MTAVGYVGGDPGKVSKTGDTMTGDLGLPGDPDAALEAAPKQYVDVVAANLATETTTRAAADTAEVTARNTAIATSTGTSANQFSVGDGAAGTKSVRFNGAAALLLQATPTASRTITLPDGTGVVLLGPDNTVEQVIAWLGSDRWLRINTPFSSNDSNPDLLRVFNAANQTFRLNGNGEARMLPSTDNRVGGRAFEFANGSTDIFFEASTNPSNSALRETLLGVYGTLHATRPGWVLVKNTVIADGVQATTSLSVGGQAVRSAPSWTNVTLGTNITKRTNTADPATALERGWVSYRGTLQWATGVTIAAGATLFIVANAAHIPATEKSFNIRSVGSGSNISTSGHLNTNGTFVVEASLGTSSGTVHLPLDGLRWDLS